MGPGRLGGTGRIWGVSISVSVRILPLGEKLVMHEEAEAEAAASPSRKMGWWSSMMDTGGVLHDVDNNERETPAKAAAVDARVCDPPSRTIYEC